MLTALLNSAGEHLGGQRLAQVGTNSEAEGVDSELLGAVATRDDHDDGTKRAEVLLDNREDRPAPPPVSPAMMISRHGRNRSGEARGIEHLAREVAGRGTPAAGVLAIPMHQANGFAYQ